MGLIEIKKGLWINADFIESIDESHDGRCRVWTIGSNDNYFSTGYSVGCQMQNQNKGDRLCFKI